MLENTNKKAKTKQAATTHKIEIISSHFKIGLFNKIYIFIFINDNIHNDIYRYIHIYIYFFFLLISIFSFQKKNQ